MVYLIVPNALGKWRLLVKPVQEKDFHCDCFAKMTKVVLLGKLNSKM